MSSSTKHLLNYNFLQTSIPAASCNGFEKKPKHMYDPARDQPGSPVIKQGQPQLNFGAVGSQGEYFRARLTVTSAALLVKGSTQCTINPRLLTKLVSCSLTRTSLLTVLVDGEREGEHAISTSLGTRHQHFTSDALNLRCSWASGWSDPLCALYTVCASRWETKITVLVSQLLYEMWKCIQNCQ